MKDGTLIDTDMRGLLKEIKKSASICVHPRSNFLVNSHVTRIEQGLKPSVDLIIKISRYFNVSTELLMKDELELE